MDAITVDALDRHRVIALQFSGGKDSLACLWLLRKHLHRITVYYVNASDEFPETRQSVEWAKTLAPHFVEIRTIPPLGTVPSDIVPTTATAFGQVASGKPGPVIVDRYVCCAKTIMQPMADRMRADKVTLVIRGQKNADELKAPIVSGAVHDGIEYVFPVQDWTDEDVLAYLRANDVPVPAFYLTLNTGLDCMGCSAWWGERRMEFLREKHPAAYKRVQWKLRYIAANARPHLELLKLEMEA